MMRHFKNPKLHMSTTLGVMLTITSILCGLFIPQIAMEITSKSNLNTVSTAPEDYYLASNTAMARIASEQLSTLDRMKLIAGTWQSTVEVASESEAFLTEMQAIEKAKKSLDVFYNAGVYPYSLSSSYNNWYSWDTEIYRYTDTSFHTYSCYLWVIRFYKFDNSLQHTILMTEKGTILAAEVNEAVADCAPIYNIYSEEKLQFALSETIYIRLIEGKKKSVKNIEVPYPGLNLTDVEFYNNYQLTLSDSGDEDEYYEVFQYRGKNVYGFGIIPTEIH